jgi:hypothetical protein
MLDSIICRLRRSQQVIDPSAHFGRAFEGRVPAHHDCRLGRDRTVAALRLLALQT